MTSRISRFHQKRDPPLVPSSSSSSFAQKITNPWAIFYYYSAFLFISLPRFYSIFRKAKKSKKRHRFRSTISHNHSIMSLSSLLKTSIIVRKTMLVSRYLPRAGAARSTSSRHGNDPEVSFYIYIYFFGVLGSCCLSVAHAIDSSGLCMYLCLDSFLKCYAVVLPNT